MGKTIRALIVVTFIVAAVAIPVYILYPQEVENIVRQWNNLTNIENVCAVNITKLPQNVPIMLEGKHLKIPVNNAFLWNDKDTRTLLACPGSDNYLKCGNLSNAEISCFKDDKFYHYEKGFSHTEDILLCDKPVESAIKSLSGTHLNGFNNEVGFQYGNESDNFVALFSVEYNARDHLAVKSSHEIYANSNFRDENFKNHAFTADNSNFTHESFQDYYVEANKQAIHYSFVDSKSDMKLVVGQLTPPQDFTIPSWQNATFYYINTFPIWNVIKSGNWKTVEDLIRQKAQISTKNLQIFTGVHQKLEFSERTIPDETVKSFPKFIWKIVKQNNLGIAFVTLNDPRNVNSPDLCVDICGKHGWDIPEKNFYQKGKTFCCEVNQLVEILSREKKIHFDGVSGVLAG